ncbi:MULTISPECIES: hypothetical protein [Niastella]|uniref:Uncharacterized protein n=1 Tax=Niastella soli TaxID=2821487 RepID=A0ABS3Z0W3_9BACT|nr:hypothetical protein [Niastella soli]MBO9203805.1 hypothetical protein [Niastella soli]
MKPQHVHQEVLIFATSTLSQRTLYRKNSSKKSISAIEELEEAFWDGLLNEIVPEIMPSIQQPEMVIWKINAGKYYLLIDLADNPGTIESTEAILSIDPHLFSSEINMS